MRTGSIGVAGLMTGLALGMLATVPSLGCDIGQRTRVEALCTVGGSGYCQGPAAAIAVDETTVYWTESLDDITWTVKGVPKKALPPAPPAELAQGRFITVEDGTLWFADPAGNVSRRDKEGNVTPLFTPTDATAVGLARDGSNVYELLSLGDPQTEWQLWSIPRDDAAPTMMASEPTDAWRPLDLTSDGTHVYFSLGRPDEQALEGEIRRVAVGTTDVEVFASEIHRPQVLREFGDNLFWYEVEEIQDTGLVKGRLQRSPKDGGNSLVLASITGSTSLAVDDAFVYWVDVGADRLWVERVPQGGGNAITSMVVLEPAGASTAIAADATFAKGMYVYWSEQGPPIPALNRILKK
jgi:hypothetical protein